MQLGERDDAVRAAAAGISIGRVERDQRLREIAGIGRDAMSD